MARRLLLAAANNNATQSRGIVVGSDFGVYLPAWPNTI